MIVNQVHIVSLMKVLLGRKYSRMDQVKLGKTAFKKFEGIWSA